jgi:hypothetical protein
MAVRAATTTFATGALALSGIVGAAVLVTGSPAAAAATCAATGTNPTASPSESGEPSGTPTSTATPTPTPTDGFPFPIPPLGGGGQGTTTATPTASGEPTDEPTDDPSATPTASPAPKKPLTFAISPSNITKGKPASAFGTGSPGCTVEIWAYTRPNPPTYKRIRSVKIADNGKFVFTIYPAGNTRAFVRSVGHTDSPTDNVDVQEVLSIRATRVGTRHFVFDGGIGPAEGQTVTVYRTSANGPVKVGAVSSGPNGGWKIDKTFTSSGTFSFYAVGTKTLNNAAGKSPTISVAVN